MNPPCDDPLQYCRFCFSQFRVEPLHSDDQKLVRLISSLIQIDLDPQQVSDSALCTMCRQQLEEFKLFRDRCHHHDSIVRSTVGGGGTEYKSGQNDLWFSVEALGVDSDEEHSAAMVKDDPLKPVPEALAKEAFWGAISRDVGVIPEHVQRALEMTGFCRNASLAMITPTTIKQIEQNMRETVELVTSGEKSQGTSRADLLRQYYGSVYCKDPTKFKFFAGEVQTILSITAAVQENGISKYLTKPSLHQRTHHARDDQLLAEKPDDAARLAEMLVQKIKDYYAQRSSDNDEFKAFFANLPQVEHCDIRQTEDGAIYARVNCPYCTTTVRLWFKGTSWRDSNFMKHCKQHYQLDQNALQVKKKRTDDG